MGLVKFHKDLIVYQKSFSSAMEIYRISRKFPREETYSLTDQILRSSRSVSANITEAWRKRRYEKSFIAKLTDADGEAAETQNWLDFAFACKYITEDEHSKLFALYDEILALLVSMVNSSEKWTFSVEKKKSENSITHNSNTPNSNTPNSNPIK